VYAKWEDTPTQTGLNTPTEKKIKLKQLKMSFLWSVAQYYSSGMLAELIKLVSKFSQIMTCVLIVGFERECKKTQPMMYWQVDRKKVKTLLICYHSADLVFGLLWVTKQPLFCHDSGFAACPVLIKTEILSFCLKTKDHPLPQSSEKS